MKGGPALLVGIGKPESDEDEGPGLLAAKAAVKAARSGDAQSFLDAVTAIFDELKSAPEDDEMLDEEEPAF